MCTCWQQCQADTDQPICAHLEQDTGQDHAHLGWCVGVRIRQPGVEREHGYLDGESYVDQQERQQLQAHRNAKQRNRYRPTEKMR